MNPNQTPASYLRSLKPIVVRNGQDLHLIDEFCSSEPLLVGIDTETTGLHPVDDRPRLLQISHSGQVVIVDLDGFRPDGSTIRWDRMPQVVKLLTGPSVKVLHNAAFDMNFLAAAGLEIGGPLFDTMIASKVINAGLAHKNDLGSVVGRYLKTELPKDLQKANWSGEITADMYGYAARDAACLPLLVSPLQSALSYARISEHITLYDVFRLEMMCLRAVASMQLRGFSFDVKQAQQLREDLLTEADKHKLAFLEALDTDIRARHPNEPEIWLPREADGSFNTREKTSGSIRLGTKVFAGFNPRSTQQMARRFKEAGILLPPDAKGGPSLDQNILAFQRKTRPLIEQYLTWKAIATRVSHVDTLIESVSPVTGRIHANYKQMGTDTGRMSCASPNLQQVPKEGTFRELFSACDGYTLLVADFSQVELRVAAHLSKEPIMVEAYKAGRDLHTETACRITGLAPEEITKEQRSSAKICNFGLLYGAGPATLQKQAVAQYGVDMELSYAKELVLKFRDSYPTLYKWQVATGEGTTKHVLTATGRRRFLVGFNDKFTTRINTRVQGTAGDITKLALAYLWEHIEKAPSGEVYILAVVHDEIVLEVKDDFISKWATILQGCMQNAGNEICYTVPIVAEVGIGKSWAEAK
jgi:DNA polymerase I